MGCLEDKPKSDEEALLQSAEKQLNSGVRLSNIALVMTTFPAILTSDEFKSAKSVLHLHEEHLNESERSHFDAFFQASPAEAGQYDKRKLEVLGLMLCKESKSDKITMLFKCGELDEGQKLQSSSLQSLLEYAFTLALDVLPATVTTKTSSHYSEAAPTRYLLRLQAQRDTACRRCWKMLVERRSALRLDTFMQNFDRTGLELSPDGVRAFTLSQCSAYWSDQPSVHSVKSVDGPLVTKDSFMST
jgi:hypothetical protein